MFPIQKEFVPRSLTLLSVYPIAKTATMKHIGSTTYVMPAADRNKIRIAHPKWACPVFDFQRDLAPLAEKDCQKGEGYSLLRIFDTYQAVRDPATDRQEDKPIMVEFVQQDLLRQWVSQSFGSNLGASGPGIIAIAGTVPTQEELDRARAMQHEFFTALVMVARDMKANGKSKEINNRHRMAGEFLGLTAATDSWLTTIKQSAMKICGATGKEIPMETIVSDGVNLIKFYQEMAPYGITPEANGDTFIAEILAKHAAATAATVQPVAEPVKAPGIPPPMAIKPPIQTKQPVGV